MNSFAKDKVLFSREQANKIYSPAAFYLSKIFFDIPFNQLFTFVSAFLLYLAVGLSLDDPNQIFFFVLLLLLVDWISRGYSAVLMIVLPNLEAANAAIPFAIIMQLLFSGLFINFKSIPNYLIWLEYMSMFKYSWGGAMINEFEIFDDDHFNGCEKKPHTQQLVLCDPVDFFNIDIPKWHNVLALFMITIIMHFLAYLSLRKLAKKFRVN
jgi:ABC-type multidrug transport system permease subunit